MAIALGLGHALALTPCPECEPVTIVVQPTNQTADYNGTVTFSVLAAGTAPIAYQWERSTDGGVSFAPLVGANLATINLSPVGAWDGYQYRVIVSNCDGDESVTSNAVTLTVLPVVTVTGAASDVTAGGYRVVTWTSSGSIAVAGAPLDVEYLVVAGGGGGGRTDRAGGGGGAGGLLTNVGGSALSLSAATHVITIGAGGVAGTQSIAGSSGSNSSIASAVVATGGGVGATAGFVAASGGSGGGGSHSVTTGGLGTTGQGNNGGTGQNSGGLLRFCGGGGGGAGAVGTDGASGGTGGNGVANTITGTSVTYAGGGGAGLQIGTASGGGSIAAGGSGGGGGLVAGTAGTNGLGGGGCGGTGASASNLAAGNGGSGVVIVRWAV